MVTSGAIARGRRLLGMERRPTAVDELQAASAVGQGNLFRSYEDRLGRPRRPRGPGAADGLRHVGADPLPERPADPAAAARLARRPGHQRERHHGHRRDHLRRQRLPLGAGGDHGRGAGACPAHRPGRAALGRSAPGPGRRADRERGRHGRARRLRHRRPHERLRLGRDAQQGGRGADGERLRDRGDDLQRHAGRDAAGGRAGRTGRDVVPAGRRPGAQLQAVAALGGAGSRPGDGRRGRRARPARARLVAAPGRGHRGRGPLLGRRPDRGGRPARHRRQGNRRALLGGARPPAGQAQRRGGRDPARGCRGGRAPRSRSC